MGKSSIEWTDATWNPIVGCSVLIWFKRKRRWKRGDKSQGRHLARIWDKLKNQAMDGEMFR